jgi:hypothetical protein
LPEARKKLQFCVITAGASCVGCPRIAANYFVKYLIFFCIINGCVVKLCYQQQRAISLKFAPISRHVIALSMQKVATSVFGQNALRLVVDKNFQLREN